MVIAHNIAATTLTANVHVGIVAITYFIAGAIIMLGSCQVS